ncbi:MAG: hypothetical protein KJ000_03610 [Pirellulaceae bacterium]|jgi:hypothetical protein|nr:hypothetical protein [Pirellulaceae bacterium]
MGKLKTSLENAGKLVKNMDKSIAGQVRKLAAFTKDTDAWVRSGSAGIDELYLYLSEKLKRKGVTFKSVENDTIKDHLDSNVANYLKGIEFTVRSAADFSASFDTLAGDESVDRDLAALDTMLDDIADQIRKKRKKLLQSKKYKAKIAVYDKTLQELKDQVAASKRSLKQMRKDKPPSPAKVRQLISITEANTLRDLAVALTRKNEGLYKVYNSLVLNLNQTANEMRQHSEFAGHIKVLNDMIDQAEEMDQA